MIHKHDGTFHYFFTFSSLKKHLLFVLHALLLLSCTDPQTESVDGHWHFTGNKELNFIYQTLDITGCEGYMNKSTAGLKYPNCLVNPVDHTIRCADGGIDTIYNYKIQADTLYLIASPSQFSLKAIRVDNCNFMDDYFVYSPIDFDLPVVDTVRGMIIARSMAFELALGRCKNTGRQCMAFGDQLISDDNEIRSEFEKFKGRVASSIRDEVFVDIYADRNVNLEQIKHISEIFDELNTSCFLIVEYGTNEQMRYGKIRLRNLDLTNTGVIDDIVHRK